MLFCPSCGNMLLITADDGKSFVCQSCPYHFKVQKTHVSRHVLKRKEVDDVLGGEGSWDNVDQTDADCPVCGNNRAYYFQLQIRSADEPSTSFYKCTNKKCNNNWREG